LLRPPIAPPSRRSPPSLRRKNPHEQKSLAAYNGLASALSPLENFFKEAIMLASGKLIGFIPTTDYKKARAFYEGKLGFEFESLDQFALVMNIGGHMIRIVKMPNFKPLQGTILGWEVDNILAAVKWLRKQGVSLEKYPFVQDQELGIWTTPTGEKVAWFKDPSGNVLSVSQHHP
jgi:catechol 2,3-dioxygenase-like lactoylglutathione lyase family enzyme